MDQNHIEKQEFYPERVSPRGQIYAWVLAIVAAVTWLILRANQQSLTTLAGVLALFLLFSAGSISLSRWMDARTVIRIQQDGVAFTNGLRNVYLKWGDIRSVRVLPDRFGARQVQVLGTDSHFEFRTLGEVRYNGQVRGRTGFEQGDRILETILKAARLKMLDSSNAQKSVYYYARE